MPSHDLSNQLQTYQAHPVVLVSTVSVLAMIFPSYTILGFSNSLSRLWTMNFKLIYQSSLPRLLMSKVEFSWTYIIHHASVTTSHDGIFLQCIPSGHKSLSTSCISRYTTRLPILLTYHKAFFVRILDLSLCWRCNMSNLVNRPTQSLSMRNGQRSVKTKRWSRL